MILVDFGGVQFNVDGMSKKERCDLERANLLMTEIAVLKNDWWTTGVLVFLVGLFVSAVIGVPTQSFFWVGTLAVVALLAGMVIAVELHHHNGLTITRNVSVLEAFLLQKKGEPCATLIRERIIRSTVLAKALERAVAHADVATVTNLG